MRSIDRISKIVFLFFITFLVAFGVVSIYLKNELFKINCPENLKFIQEKNLSLNRVSILLWLSLCQERKILFASSEATGAYKLPFYLRQQHQYFYQFTGAHRGIKTFAFVSGLDLNKDLAKKINALLILNPIYFTEGLAQTSAAMGYRTAITNADFNEVIGVPVAKSRPLLERIWVVTKNTFDDIQDIVRLKWGTSYDVISEDNIDESYKPNIPSDYNLQKGVLNQFNGATFATEIKFERSPTTEMFDLVALNKNAIKQCVVILPMNIRFFRSQNEKYVEQIRILYNEMVPKINPKELIDLTDLQNESYLFMDIMHSTEYGSKLIAEKIQKSDCYRNNWLK